MLINPINLISTQRLNFSNKNINFQKTNYKLEKDTVSFSSKNTISKNEIIETIDKSYPISDSGLKGIVYKYDKDSKSYAIKVAREEKFKFDNEANVLKQVPQNINCQRFVSYFQHPNTNCDVLVSTFVEGKNRNLENSKDYFELFNLLLRLDMAQVLHGDLNMQNWIFNSDGINLIDFGEGEIFQTGETYEDYIYPKFVLKSNIVNLEHNGIPDCIQVWNKTNSNTKELFKDYLIAKSEFYSKHVEFLKSQNKDLSQAIDFEQNYSNILKNPSDKIIENEIRRLDCLYTFEQADTAVHYKNIPSSAIQIWNLTIQKANEQLEFINQTLSDDDLSTDERKYFEYQKEIITLFFKQFNSWGSSTINWLNSLENKGNLSNYEKKFIDNKNETMALPPNLVEMVLR